MERKFGQDFDQRLGKTGRIFRKENKFVLTVTVLTWIKLIRSENENLIPIFS